MGTTQTIEEAEESRPAPIHPPSEFAVSGMTCANCARHVTEAIQSVPGVSSVTVNLEAQRASVRWASGGDYDAAAVIEAVEKAGYEAKAIDVQEPGHPEHKLAGWRLNLWV